jgi:chromosome segregation and condensation protein ScpB
MIDDLERAIEAMLFASDEPLDAAGCRTVLATK